MPGKALGPGVAAQARLSRRYRFAYIGPRTPAARAGGGPGAGTRGLCGTLWTRAQLPRSAEVAMILNVASGVIVGEFGCCIIGLALGDG